MSSALVFVFPGQSNNVGEHPVTVDYRSLSDCWMIGLDGFVRPMSEPCWDNTNFATGAIIRNNPDVNPGQSKVGAYFAQLRAQGATETLVAVMGAAGSTSADAWGLGLADSPATYLNLYGSMWHQIDEAFRFPNALFGCVVPDQGEADAQIDLATANAWGGKWNTIFNAFLARAASRGYGWKKTTLRFQICALQLGSTLAFKAQVNAQQFGLAGSRTDTHTLQNPDASPPDLHLWAAQQIQAGTALAVDYGLAA